MGNSIKQASERLDYLPRMGRLPQAGDGLATTGHGAKGMTIEGGLALTARLQAAPVAEVAMGTQDICVQAEVWARPWTRCRQGDPSFWQTRTRAAPSPPRPPRRLASLPVRSCARPLLARLLEVAVLGGTCRVGAGSRCRQTLKTMDRSGESEGTSGHGFDSEVGGTGVWPRRSDAK
jgi:hypothetical protein